MGYGLRVTWDALTYVEQLLEEEEAKGPGDGLALPVTHRTLPLWLGQEAARSRVLALPHARGARGRACLPAYARACDKANNPKKTCPPYLVYLTQGSDWPSTPTPSTGSTAYAHISWTREQHSVGSTR